MTVVTNNTALISLHEISLRCSRWVMGIELIFSTTLFRDYEVEDCISRVVPKPDSDIVSHIHVVVIAPQTNKRVVNITCLTLQKS